MRDGWWVNYDSRAYVGLHCLGAEHEKVLRDPEYQNQKWLGIPHSVSKEFRSFKPRKDRVKLLKFAMKTLPLMRIRGYGSKVSFQFNRPESDPRPYMAVKRWIHRFGGDALLLVVTNLSTNMTVSVQASDWDTFMKTNSSKSEEVLSKRLPKHPSKTPAKTVLSDKQSGAKSNGD